MGLARDVACNARQQPHIRLRGQVATAASVSLSQPSTPPSTPARVKLRLQSVEDGRLPPRRQGTRTRSGVHAGSVCFRPYGLGM